MRWSDIDHPLFVIGDKDIEIDAYDIYFIIGLCKSGLSVQLSGSRPCGDITDMIISRNCSDGSQKTKSENIDIKIVNDPALKIVLYTISRVARVQALHEMRKSQFQYVVGYMTPTIFN